MKTISADRQIYAFSPRMTPAAHASPGETLAFEAQDALGGQVRAETDVLTDLDFSRINPATGPVYVEGAEPGDTLVVRVVSIEPAGSGAIVTGPGWAFSERRSNDTRRGSSRSRTEPCCSVSSDSRPDR